MDRLTIKDVDNLYQQERDEENAFTTNILEQLADTMRENGKLKDMLAAMVIHERGDNLRNGLEASIECKIAEEFLGIPNKDPLNLSLDVSTPTGMAYSIGVLEGFNAGRALTTQDEPPQNSLANTPSPHSIIHDGFGMHIHLTEQQAFACTICNNRTKTP